MSSVVASGCAWPHPFCHPRLLIALSLRLLCPLSSSLGDCFKAQSFRSRSDGKHKYFTSPLLCLYLRDCGSLSLPVSVSPSLSVSLSLSLSLWLSLSLSLSIYLSLPVSICLSLSVSLSLPLSICLSLCLSLCLYRCIYIDIVRDGCIMFFCVDLRLRCFPCCLSPSATLFNPSGCFLRCFLSCASLPAAPPRLFAPNSNSSRDSSSSSRKKDLEWRRLLSCACLL